MEHSKVSRSLGLFPTLSIVMGTVIGAGVFFKVAGVTQSTGSSSLSLFAWLLGGLISLCGGLTVAELAASMPEEGGMIKYIEHTYGPMAAFLLGWAQVVLYFPAMIAALAIICGQQFVVLFDLTDSWVTPLAMLFVILILAINFLSARAGGLFQSFTLILKMIPIALIVLFGLFQPHDVAVVTLFPVEAGKNLSFTSALGAGLLATMFAYDGWIHVGNVAGEVKKPERTLPLAITIGLIGVTVIYLLVNFTFIRTLGFAQVVGNENAAAQVAARLFGAFGGKLVTIGILISVYGAINGYTLTGMRQPYTLALEKRLPFWKQLAKLSPRTQVPVNSGLFQTGITLLLILISMISSNAFNNLSNLLVFVIWIFYTLVFFAVPILRLRDGKLETPYRVPLYPVIPIISILGGLFILMMTLVNQPELALIGIGLTLLGLPFYLYLSRKYGN